MIPGLGRRPGEGNGYLLQDSGLENLMDYTVHGVAKSWTQLSYFTFTFHFAWRIPGTGEPGGLPSMGLHRVGHD